MFHQGNNQQLKWIYGVLILTNGIANIKQNFSGEIRMTILSITQHLRIQNIQRHQDSFCGWNEVVTTHTLKESHIKKSEVQN